MEGTLVVDTEAIWEEVMGGILGVIMQGFLVVAVAVAVMVDIVALSAALQLI